MNDYFRRIEALSAQKRELLELWLQEEGFDSRSLDGLYTAPRTELEQAIAAVWREVLQVEQVGTHDRFFDLGGHSLLLAQVQHQLKATLSVDVSIVDLFQYPTISALARHLAPDNSGLDAPAERSVTPRGHHVPGQTETAIAIIGMSGRFPGAPDLATFWRNLCAGVESIAQWSDADLLAAGVDPRLLRHPHYVRAGTLLDHVSEFDAQFFEYTPREAALIDPQQRLFLECAWETLEQAGYVPDADDPALRVGVYAGVGLNSYFLFHLLPQDGWLESIGTIPLATANDKDYLATRVSYKLNLTGPSLTVQTACSSSLVAVHLACQAIAQGECEMALAGGVSVSAFQPRGYLYQPGGIVSPDGHCRAFDAGAQGTVFGSGLGLVLLKPLAAALADGDSVYAVIKGSAINNDGAAKVGYTAPSVAGQAAVVAQALARAQVAPETIGFIETHGTGTPLGDPIEIAALARVFPPDAAPCALGAVKTNVGHLDAAAGIAGLLKAILALQHGNIPPTLHITQPNPQLPLADTPFFFPSTLTPWPALPTHPRRAGVSAFGIGGTNAHVVLEEPPPVPAPAPAAPSQLLLVSARSPGALELASERLASALESQPPAALPDIAHTLHVGRRAFPYRRMLVADDPAAAAAALRSPAQPPVYSGHVAPGVRPAVVFLFPGQGSQVVGMGQALAAHEPVFRAEVERCCELLAPELGYDLRQWLWPAPEARDQAATMLARTEVAQPALFAIEYALARLWISWGVAPRAMLGHSLGEYVAACLAGVFSLEQALRLVVARGRLMAAAAEGAMLAVGLGADALAGELDQTLDLAAVNSARQCVVGGPVAAIAALEERLAARGVRTRRLASTRAFHTRAMAGVAPELAVLAAGVALQAPRVPLIANPTGQWLTAAEAGDPAYWGRQAMAPVSFEAGVATVAAEIGAAVWLEVGSGQTLGRLVLEGVGKDAAVVSSLGTAGAETELAQVRMAQGQVWLAGGSVAGVAGAAAGRRRVPLPTYPFERQRLWVAPPALPAATSTAAILPGQIVGTLPSWKRTRAPGAFRPVERQSWVIMALGDARLGEAIEGYLAGQEQAVWLLRPGSTFEEYMALFATLAEQGARPAAVVLAWGGGDADAGVDIAAQAERANANARIVLHAAQALAQSPVYAQTQLVLVSSQMHKVTYVEEALPAQSIVGEIGAALMREHPQLRCCSIDSGALPLDSARLTRLVEQVLAEVQAGTTGAVAYRGLQRWSRSFEPVALEDAAELAMRPGDAGVYLVAGAGEMTLIVARALRRLVQAPLIVVGLAFAGEREVDLDTLGDATQVYEADPADHRRVGAILAQAVARHGALRGMLYVAAPGAAHERDLPRWAFAHEAAISALVELPQASALDFCIVIGADSAAYDRPEERIRAAGALAFRDACTSRWSKIAHAPCVSLRCDTRLMAPAPDDAQVEQLWSSIIAQVVTLTPEGSVILSAADAAARRAPDIDALPAEAPVPAAQDSFTQARPNLASLYVAPRTDIERRMAELWQAALGIEQVGVHDHFVELGGSSLLAVQLIADLHNAFQVRLALQTLFEKPTIAALAEHLEAVRWFSQEAPAGAGLESDDDEGGAL